MLTNAGWLVFVPSGSARRYVTKVVDGEPAFSSCAMDAQFSEEYEARQLAQIVEHLYEGARAMYVPWSVRKEWQSDVWGLAV